MRPSENRAQSVYALKKLLTEIIKYPEDWSKNQKLINVLSSQGRLAAWSDDEKGILGCALNTLKSSADETLEGGYESLDQLRKNAAQAISDLKNSDQTPSKRTKVGLKKLIAELERKVCLLEQQNLLLVYLINDVKTKAVKYASQGSETTYALCEKEMCEVNAKIGFCGNVKLIAKALAHES